MDWDDFPVILGQGAMHDLRDGEDPRNPRLAGLKSVSWAGAVGLAKRRPNQNARRIGFHRPPTRTA